MSQLRLTPTKPVRHYLPLHTERCAERFGEGNHDGLGLLAYLLERHQEVKGDHEALQELIEDDELEIVEGHPYVDIIPVLTTRAQRTKPEDRKELRAIWDEEGEDAESPYVASIIVDAGGDWTLYHKGLSAAQAKKWPAWSALSLGTKVKLVAELDIYDLGKIQRKVAQKPVTVADLGKSLRQSKSSPETTTSTTAKAAQPPSK